MKTRGALAFVVLVLGIGLSACGDSDDGGGEAASSSKPAEWDMMVPVPAAASGDGTTNILQRFTEEVDKETGGRLKITIRNPGELPYTSAETVSSVGGGRVQLGDTGAFIAAESKVGAITQLPLLVQSIDEFEEVLPVVLPALETDLERFGASVLFTYSWPMQVLWGSGDAVTSLDGLDGRSVRTTSPEQAYLIQELGGDPTSLTSAEVATAMQRGVADTLTTAAFVVYASKWDEFVDWGYMAPINQVPSYILVNDKAMASLPEDVRTTLTELAEKYQALMFKEVPGFEQKYRDQAAKDFTVTDVTQADLDKSAAIMEPQWTKWAADNDLEPLMKSVREKLGR